MVDPRYPVGPFASVGRPLTQAERRARIDILAAHPERLRAAVRGLSDAQLDTPYRDGGWTARQLVHHVADSHLNAYVRFKLAVTQDHPTIMPYDQDAWSALPDARQGPVEDSLAALDALHRRWVAFLRALESDAFLRTLHHPESGDLTVDRLLEIYAWHGPHHEAHVVGLRRRMGW